jgi:hypothetical protein
MPLWNRRHPTDDPVDEINVALIENRLKSIEKARIDVGRVKMGLGKAADKPVGLAGTAMSRAIHEALTSVIHRFVYSW